MEFRTRDGILDMEMGFQTWGWSSRQEMGFQTWGWDSRHGDRVPDMGMGVPDMGMGFQTNDGVPVRGEVVISENG